MVENDPNVALAVETMDEQAYGSHFAGRYAAVSTLPHTVVDYPGKKMLLEQAIKVEKDATDALRTLANVTVTAGAANDLDLPPPGWRQGIHLGLLHSLVAVGLGF